MLDNFKIAVDSVVRDAGVHVNDCVCRDKCRMMVIQILEKFFDYLIRKHFVFHQKDCRSV